MGLAAGTAPVGGIWGDTTIVLPGAPASLHDTISGWRHAPQGDTLLVADVLRDFPVAALFGDDIQNHDESRRKYAGTD
jgi:maltooligosyltrehalose synthase